MMFYDDIRAPYSWAYRDDDIIVHSIRVDHEVYNEPISMPLMVPEGSLPMSMSFHPVNTLTAEFTCCLEGMGGPRDVSMRVRRIVERAIRLNSRIEQDSRGLLTSIQPYCDEIIDIQFNYSGLEYVVGPYGDRMNSPFRNKLLSGEIRIRFSNKEENLNSFYNSWASNKRAGYFYSNTKAKKASKKFS